MQNELTDKKLYKKYLNGDNKAFESLVLKYKDHIIYFISTYTKNTQIAEDISQDVFVYLLLNKEQYDFKYSFKTYLYMIAKCRAINYIKKEKKVIKILEYENLCIEDNDLEEIVFKNSENQKIRKIIKKLKQGYQEIIYLTIFEGFKYKEVARIMDKSIAQVKGLLHRAKKKLKELLESEGYTYDV